MTLNDNPRVDAEKRFWMLRKRRDRIMHLTNHSIEYDSESGYANRLYLNPDRKRGSKLIDRINKELTQLDKFLKSFK